MSSNLVLFVPLQIRGAIVMADDAEHEVLYTQEDRGTLPHTVCV